MNGKTKKAWLILGMIPLLSQAFVVEKIQYEGVERVPLSSVAANTPVKVGEDLTPALSSEVITDLFKTGYFKNVQLYNQNGTLLIQLEELPAIAKIDIKGNELIKTAQLQSVLNSVGLQVGNMLNQPLIDQIKQSLIAEYNSQGKYAVQVNVETTPVSNNRVNLTINISEGLDVKIKDINITGNHIFSSKKLIAQLPISTPGIIAFFTGKSVYTANKMNQTMQSLLNFYLNNGYLDARANSVQASFDSTATKAYITINISEGQQYHFTGFGFKGNLILPETTLAKLVQLKAGDIYSKQTLLNAEQAIVAALGDQGYAFANVNPVPTVDKNKRTVFINFYIAPGQKVYINQLEFNGNTVANDRTLRERMMFVEGSTYSKTAVDNSTVALERLPYMQQVNEITKPVEGTNNQVNLDYNLTETAANSINGAIGYGGLYGVILQAGFNMNNLFGTGNSFGINAQVSKPYQSVNINFSQPFFTLSGISQSVGFYFTRNNAADEGLTNFSTNSTGATLSYAIPISTWNSFYFGGQLDHTSLQQPDDSQSATVNAFTNQYGKAYNTYSLNFGWQRDSTNSAYFPTQGQTANVGANVAIPGSDLTWYKLNANANLYHAISSNVTLMLSGGVYYGNGYGKTTNLPFFQNYYSGGWGSVRGYQTGEMGPQDTNICTDSSVCTPGSTSEGAALGGNLMLNGVAQLYFPVPFYNKPNIKLISFIDAGNAYQTYNSSGVWNAANSPTHPTFNNIAYTAGVGIEMANIPVLQEIGFSLAKPLNNLHDDDTEFFQFTLGTFF